MTTQIAPPAVDRPQEAGLRYGLFMAAGWTMGMGVVRAMLADGEDAKARLLNSGEPLPMGVTPVIVAETTVYASFCVEHLLRNGWSVHLPRPWLVLVSDVPAPPPAAVSYRVRALGSRLVGTATVPYLPVLRTVENSAQAMEHRDVQAAGRKLRRQIEGN
ncbi:hypothetical protein M8Z33_42275 [Streptomyces sp. ZAF1911]|uniref:hypothetical protein n=1 Tax=Streptomyces sp. ZAF1911 TaxID=2944129 RepID=UPI00237C4273|nr:hypothetical protein [Streptomyces sp. ZAF1911]MDD9383167.1 hypothetical protein [Streptomyces sp. ZAF1911]